jgi:ketosteroid isomerase-like protein
MDEQSRVQEVIEQYVMSVNRLDTEKAKTLWLEDPKISFIHPRGHETGLEQIIRLFYQETMGKFSQRKLMPYNESITIVGDAALVVFYWKFDATFAHDNSPHHTEGRETQIMIKVDNEWKLMHIHYSGLPVSGDREGF